ncbi:MAG TPA: protein-disulfide reductase DsbD domain-containing protein [Thermoanaerobaculia bacterium]|nr:protein-disulfide reductase DsbD domain-containing protein [Thermoanaerobaculia bacterium]
MPKILLAAVLGTLAVLGTALPARGAVSEWQKNPQSSVRLITSWVVAPRSGDLMLGLQFRLAPGWHVYWKNSGDAGFPPSVTFKPERILGKPDLLWPQPSRFELPGGLVALGYEDEVVYPVLAVIRPGSILPPLPEDRKEAGESFRITADLDYLICEVDCIPYRYTLTVDQRVGFPTLADPETGPLLDTWLARLPRTLAEVPDVKVSTVLDMGRRGGPDFEVRLVGVEQQPGKTDLFLETSEALNAGKPRVGTFPGGVVFHVPVKPRDVSKPLPEKLEIGWTATNLSKGGDSFDLAVRYDVQVAAADAGPAPARRQAARGGPRQLAKLLLWAFLGGVLLNLTPTVLALLAGESLALRGGAAGEAAGGVREGAAAAATGVIGACWGIAGLAIAAHRAGVPAGWGAQLQEPALAALLAVASALLALNLWGLVEVPLAPAGAAGTGTGRHLLAGAFTVPLALAWPVPMVQEPLGYAFGRGPATVCAIYSVIGFGLALPYLVLTLVPAAARLIPTPGPWLPRLREGVGFLAAASTFWMLYALSGQVRPEGLAGIELALLGLSLFAWLRAREGVGRTLRLALVLGLAACGAAALWMADLNRMAERPALFIPSVLSSDPGLPPDALEPTPNG